MAALKGNRRMGCSVASAAASGFRQKLMKSGDFARSARYSGRYRPAWRMNQTGGRSNRSPARARRNFGPAPGTADGSGDGAAGESFVMARLSGKGARRQGAVWPDGDFPSACHIVKF